MGFGLASTALFWDAPIGVNLLVWAVAALGVNVAVFGRRSLRPVALGAIALCLTFSVAIVRLESDWALTIAVPGALACVGVLPILLGERSTFADVGRLPALVVAAIKRAPPAALRVARLPEAAITAGRSGRVGSALKGLLIGVPIAGAFALLFASDAGFRGALGRLQGRGSDALVFALEAILVALVALVSHFASARPDAAPAEEEAFDPYRVSGVTPIGLRARLRVAPLTWGIVQVQVLGVFGLFVAANARQLFGGASFVRDDASTTYASYLHAGFGQLLLAAMLAVLVVLAGQSLVALPAEGRPVRSRVLVALDVLVVGCAGLTLVSCYQRLSIYVDAYGASHQRLGVALVMLFVAGVLGLTLARSLFARWRGYASAFVAFAFGFLAVASHVDADAYVTRTNLDRAARGAALDVDYLGDMTPDALAALDHPYLRANPDVEAELQWRICHPAKRLDWRSFRGLARCPAP